MKRITKSKFKYPETISLFSIIELHLVSESFEHATYVGVRADNVDARGVKIHLEPNIDSCIITNVRQEEMCQKSLFDAFDSAPELKSVHDKISTHKYERFLAVDLIEEN